MSKLRKGEEISAQESQCFEHGREARIQAILERPLEEMFDVQEVNITLPEKAAIHHSIPCTECGLATMATRVRYFRGKPYCIPCFDKLTQADDTSKKETEVSK